MISFAIGVAAIIGGSWAVDHGYEQFVLGVSIGLLLAVVIMVFA